MDKKSQNNQNNLDDDLFDFDIEAGYEEYGDFASRELEKEEHKEKELKAAQSLNQPQSAKGKKEKVKKDKASSKQVKNKVKQTKNPETPGGIQPNKLWGIIGALIVIIPLIAIIVMMKSGTGLFESGIKRVGNPAISGYTISQLDGLEVKVSNKSLKDVSADTIWEINGLEVGTGSNTISLDRTQLVWGTNYIKATNGEDVVDYTLELTKSIDTDDDLHNKLSTLVTYPDGAYSNVSGYEVVSEEQLDSIAKQYKDTIVYDNGFVKTKQTYNNATLEVVESTAYSLSMSDPLRVNPKFRGDSGIEIIGDFSKVDKAELSFKVDKSSANNYIVYQVVDNEFNLLDTEKYYYYNGNIVINLESAGIYILKDRDDMVNYSTILNLYNIYILKPDNIDGNSGQVGTEAAEPSEAEPSETVNPPTNEIGEPDQSNSLPTDGAASTGSVDFPQNITINQEPKGLDISYYAKTLDKLLEEAINSSKIKIESNIITYESSISEKYTNIVSATNYGGDIETTNNTNIVEALKAGFIGNSTTSPNQKNYYSKNILILVDLTDLNFETCKNTSSILGDLTRQFKDYDFNIVFMGSTIGGIKALGSYSDSAIIYETNSFNFNNATVSKLVSDIKNGVFGIELNGETIQVQPVVDSGFRFGENNYIEPLTFNTELQGSNSYGICLLSRLGFSREFEAIQVESPKVLYSSEIILPGTNISDSRVGVTLNSDTEGYINTCSLNTLSEKQKLEVSQIINQLTLAQLNSLAGSMSNLETLNTEQSFSGGINLISEQLGLGKLVLGNIGNEFGSSTVLVTKISQDIQDPTRYYLHLYDPTDSTKENIATIQAVRAIRDESIIGTKYIFEYTNTLGTFTSFDLITKIQIYNGEDWQYEWKLR